MIACAQDCMCSRLQSPPKPLTLVLFPGAAPKLISHTRIWAPSTFHLQQRPTQGEEGEETKHIAVSLMSKRDILTAVWCPTQDTLSVWPPTWDTLSVWPPTWDTLPVWCHGCLIITGWNLTPDGDKLTNQFTTQTCDNSHVHRWKFGCDIHGRWKRARCSQLEGYWH